MKKHKKECDNEIRRKADLKDVLRRVDAELEKHAKENRPDFYDKTIRKPGPEGAVFKGEEK